LYERKEQREKNKEKRALEWMDRLMRRRDLWGGHYKRTDGRKEQKKERLPQTWRVTSTPLLLHIDCHTMKTSQVAAKLEKKESQISKALS